MARSGAVKHTHKYYKNNSGLWTCARPGCSHYLPTNVADKIEFSKSICWQCEQEFNLNSILICIDRPKCQVCLAPQFTSLEDYVKDRERKAIEEKNKRVIKVERDGLGNRLLYDDKGNVTVEKIETDSGLIIDGDDDDDAIGVLKK